MTPIIDFDFSDFGIKGSAYSFTEETFARYVDEHLRNAEDAAASVLVRNVCEPGFEEVEKVRRTFPLFGMRLVDVLCEDAGYVRESAMLIEELVDETPPHVLRMAGLTPEEAAKLRADSAPNRLRLVIVRDGERKKLFACVLRTDDTAVALLREDRKKGKGYGKACRSAALSSIAWSDVKPEDAFARWPAIPALVLAEQIIDMGGADTARKFRRR